MDAWCKCIPLPLDTMANLLTEMVPLAHDHLILYIDNATKIIVMY